MFKVLYVIANICQIIAWFLASSTAEAVEDICLEPEYDEYNQVYYDETEMPTEQ